MEFCVESTQSRCKELAGVSSFCRLVYSEIEEIGWEQLVRSNDKLSFLSFRILDKKERVHILEIQLHESYPQYPPSIAADVPYICHLKWSANSRLKDVIQQFQKHLEKLQEFWNITGTIDKLLWVAGSQQQSRATSYRQINLANDCCLMLCLDAANPTSLPDCRFMGPDPLVNSLTKRWRRNSKKWSRETALIENLERILEIQLPRPPDAHGDQFAECGICYAQFLPTDGGSGAEGGLKADYTCENMNCSRAFHSICLGDWLQSITTTRRLQKVGISQGLLSASLEPGVSSATISLSSGQGSYDVLFGNCPYCSEPVAIKLGGSK